MLKALFFTYQEFHKTYCDSNRAYNRDLYDIRNSFEHRFVFISEEKKKSKIKVDLGNLNVGYEKLYEYTFELLTIVREMIICLKYSVLLDQNINSQSGYGKKRTSSD